MNIALETIPFPPSEHKVSAQPEQTRSVSTYSTADAQHSRDCNSLVMPEVALSGESASKHALQLLQPSL